MGGEQRIGAIQPGQEQSRIVSRAMNMGAQAKESCNDAI